VRKVYVAHRSLPDRAGAVAAAIKVNLRNIEGGANFDFGALAFGMKKGC